MNNPKDIERFMGKIIKISNCWIWIAAKNKNGYGFFTIKSENVLAHRVSYQLFKGDIPKGLTLDHLCRNRACVNPEHLEAVTQKENNLRSNKTITSINKSKTHCPKGHVYYGDNLRIWSGKRYCRKCYIIKHKERRLKLKVS